MDGFTQQDAALVEAASIAAEATSNASAATSNASAAACIATTRADWDLRDADTPLAARAACDTQRILETIRIAMSLTAPPPRSET